MRVLVTFLFTMVLAVFAVPQAHAYALFGEDAPAVAGVADEHRAIEVAEKGVRPPTVKTVKPPQSKSSPRSKAITPSQQSQRPKSLPTVRSTASANKASGIQRQGTGSRVFRNKVYNPPQAKFQSLGKARSKQRIFTQAKYGNIQRSQRALNKIQKQHLNPKRAKRKSQFNNKVTMNSVLTAAQGKPYTVSGKNGNHVRTFNMKRHIGKMINGKPTKTVTVVTTPLGELVTAFPGKPRVQ